MGERAARSRCGRNRARRWHVVGVILAYDDDMVAAEESVGDQLTPIGNRNSLEILRRTPEETIEKANEVMKASAAGGGFVLGIQGPELPIGVDDAAIKVLVDAGHNWKY